jgi:hypothetical protein
MKNKPYWQLLILIFVLIIVSLACNAVSGGDQDSPTAPVGAESTEIPTLAPSMTDIPTEPPPPEPTEPSAPEADQPPPPTEKPPESPSGHSEIDTNFPLPDDVQNFMQLDENSINFQTSMSLQQVVDFYRQTFTTQGLTERPILTSITDSTVSMVFDGATNGMAIVLQCVDLGDGTTNVNLRYEDV